MPGFKIWGEMKLDRPVPTDIVFYPSFLWEVLEVVGNMAIDRNLSSAEKDAIIMLKTASLPSISFKKVVVDSGSIEYKFAGSQVYEDIKIGWYDSVGMASLMNRWINSIINSDGGINAPSKYKFRTTIIKNPLSDDKPNGQVRYNLFGSWPVALKESDLTYIDSSIKSVEMTISYDRYKIEVENDNQNRS
jgi:hypothetical protein